MARRTWLQAGMVGLAATALLAGCAGTPSGDSPVGSWGLTQSGKPNVKIESDGTVSGTDGCNQLSGKGTIDGDTITFGKLATTLMACEGVDEWFSKAAKGRVTGSSLTIFDDKGEKIGMLGKA